MPPQFHLSTAVTENFGLPSSPFKHSNTDLKIFNSVTACKPIFRFTNLLPVYSVLRVFHCAKKVEIITIIIKIPFSSICDFFTPITKTECAKQWYAIIHLLCWHSRDCCIFSIIWYLMAILHKSGVVCLWQPLLISSKVGLNNPHVAGTWDTGQWPKRKTGCGVTWHTKSPAESGL